MNISKVIETELNETLFIYLLIHSFFNIGSKFQLILILFLFHRLYVTSASGWWTQIVSPVFSEASDGGVTVTASELASILQNPSPSGTSLTDVETFVQRLNNTIYNWQNGIMNGTNMLDPIQFSNTLTSLNSYTNEAVNVTTMNA